MTCLWKTMLGAWRRGGLPGGRPTRIGSRAGGHGDGDGHIGPSVGGSCGWSARTGRKRGDDVITSRGESNRVAGGERDERDPNQSQGQKGGHLTAPCTLIGNRET